MVRKNRSNKTKGLKERYETPEIEKIKISNTYKLSLTWPDTATFTPSCPGESGPEP